MSAAFEREKTLLSATSAESRGVRSDFEDVLSQFADAISVA
jgi:hypothetical protein